MIILHGKEQKPQHTNLKDDLTNWNNFKNNACLSLRSNCGVTPIALTRKNSSLCFNRWEFLVIVGSSWNANACVSFSSCWWTTKTISLILSIFIKYLHQRKTPFANPILLTVHTSSDLFKKFFLQNNFSFFVKIVFFAKSFSSNFSKYSFCGKIIFLNF